MPLPDIKHCLICEDIRLERRNLNSLMGVYGATPYVGIRIRDFRLNTSFCFLFMGAPTHGKYSIQLVLRDPSGAQMGASVFPQPNEQSFSPEWGATVIAFRVNAIFPGPNIYKVALLGDGAEFFSDTFRLEQGSPSDFL
jgi:hypothetical protein